jgi:hypothetical protein
MNTSYEGSTRTYNSWGDVETSGYNQGCTWPGAPLKGICVNMRFTHHLDDSGMLHSTLIIRNWTWANTGKWMSFRFDVVPYGFILLQSTPYVTTSAKIDVSNTPMVNLTDVYITSVSADRQAVV